MKVKTTYRFTGLCIAASIVALGWGACNYTADYKKDEDKTTLMDTAAVGSVDNTRDLNDVKDTAGSIEKPSTAIANTATAAARPVHSTGSKYKTFVAMPVNSSSEMVMDKEGVYNAAQVMPQFPGGHKALEKYLNNHIDYPDQAINDDATGMVKVSFVVDEKGKVRDAHIVGKDRVGDGVEQEAIRTVLNMPAWQPGKVHGKNVKTRLELPINFQLDV